ncbi:MULTISPECIES: helix-turn-helix domain-containing protein [Amycolatopsis]|uniref:Helix-turn-helix transcriptional regulator n=1 Tax=Amycolatopsis dongchuanensis TaxID=1070866 RepID=A0ABP8VWI4_9PSEU
MPTDDNLSSRRTRLGEQLQRLRKATRVSGRTMAADLGWSQPKISRAESGLNLPPLEDIRRWLDYCNASEQQKEEVLGLAEDIATEVVTNRELNRGGHAAQQRVRIQHDADADLFCIYQPEVVPGFLQTPEYTRRLLLEIGAATPDTVADSVAARMERQAILYDESKTISAVITETALAWQPWPASVSREQLDRLRTLAALPNVHIGIVSREQQKKAPTSNSFVLTHWPDGATDVVTESLTAEVTITDPADVAVYQRMFKKQQEFAAYDEAALVLLDRIADELD